MRRWISISAGALACCAMLGVAACTNTTSVGGSGGSGGSGGDSSSSGGPGATSSTGAGGSGSLATTDKVDLLFAIDNSRSMADKQAILALALEDLVQSLVNPPCLDGNGNAVPGQPGLGSEPCPAGSQRAYAAVNDIHIGVITSSLGGHGSDSCPNSENNTCSTGTNISNNDKGHLLSRTDPCKAVTVTTYQDKGFLAWDPAGTLSPPGEANAAALASNFKDIVLGAGQIGCGYESQLESWYRFLVDPEPYQSISIVDGKAEAAGIDSVVLQERADFLRPDSLLAILTLSDENDCSTKEFGQFFYANQLKNGNGTQFHLPRARAECATNPNDPCCKSCGQAPGQCPADPTCVDGNGQVKALSNEEDPSNLRCFDQKRRFGIDFLYPTDRYIQALTSPTVPDRAGNLVANPIFSNLSANPATPIRDPGLVVLTGIVGVPWQDIARDKDDLAKGFKTAAELNQPVAGKPSAWDVILGNPATYVAPSDPLMVESIDPRTGTNPITGDALVQPGNAPTNPINGSEYTTSVSRDDLQYACVFELDQPRDCGDPGTISCDCKDPSNDNPLCAEDPTKPGSKTLQVRAKAYPGIRQLTVLKGVQGVVASICPSQTTDPTKADYAYRPAIQELLQRLSTRLVAASD